MRVHVRDAVGRLALQAIDVPELGGVGPRAQDVVNPQSDIPIVAERVVCVSIPFPVTAALDLIVR